MLVFMYICAYIYVFIIHTVLLTTISKHCSVMGKFSAHVTECTDTNHSTITLYRVRRTAFIDFAYEIFTSQLGLGCILILSRFWTGQGWPCRTVSLSVQNNGMKNACFCTGKCNLVKSAVQFAWNRRVRRLLMLEVLQNEQRTLVQNGGLIN